MSMKFHCMQLPREVIVGRGTLELIGEVCKKLGYTRSAFLVVGPHTLDIAGRKVLDLLEEEKINVEYFVVNSSTVEDLVNVQARLREVKPEVVLGIGGGTKIDVAKLSSARLGIPFISVPTTASHDGIASP